MNGEKIENFDEIIIKGEEIYKTFLPIPFWGINKETKKRKMHGGNPEED